MSHHILIRFQSLGINYLHDINISSVTDGRENSAGKVYEGLQLNFISDSIGCENVEIIRITRGAKVGFWFEVQKNTLVLGLLS